MDVKLLLKWLEKEAPIFKKTQLFVLIQIRQLRRILIQVFLVDNIFGVPTHYFIYVIDTQYGFIPNVPKKLWCDSGHVRRNSSFKHICVFHRSGIFLWFDIAPQIKDLRPEIRCAGRPKNRAPCSKPIFGCFPFNYEMYWPKYRDSVPLPEN